MKKLIPLVVLAAMTGSLFLASNADASTTLVKHKKHHKKHHHHHHHHKKS